MTLFFHCEKQPATAAKGMVVTNHPLASAAGVEMLAAGGNAVDAAIAALFTLTVVEPMMVGIFGGGMAHLRLSDGRHMVIDGLSTAPQASHAECYRPLSDTPGPDYLETEGRENAVGAKAVALPGNLKAWCETLQRFGRLPLQDVIQPAIRHAAQGFVVTPYLAECVAECAADLTCDPEISRRYLPGGAPIKAGAKLVQGDYAETLRLIAREGAAALYGGTLGDAIVTALQMAGGWLTRDDLLNYRTIEREPVRGMYRGFEIIGPPPPSSGGVHVIQMLNILEGYDIGALGFGSPEALHLLAEVLKIAFADRAAATADPAFVDVPVEKLISKTYAAERRAKIDPHRAQSWSACVAAGESANTTHVTVADADGHVVSSTQTINSLFGARFILPGTGVIPNNYMYLFDPHPGKALSVAPNKRITTSQAPLMALQDGKPVYALGLPGGLRIFGSAMQALVNLIDHGMTLQQAVEAPRLWTQGQMVELEDGFPQAAREALISLGHDILPVPHVGGGMNAIRFLPETAGGGLEGAACWRADGTPMGVSGGLARAGVRFWPDAPRR
ncbi:gamma-glutamyltransferase [Ferrovibrio sp.]|uniref:gamma-glutamyltransferase n=1 Tax=Ferrovibrio sp. TaxID=1917215 RepID=UPI0026241D7F|nr:gamma-glutamyltransferase [Ferrovibrio sp.]